MAAREPTRARVLCVLRVRGVAAAAPARRGKVLLLVLFLLGVALAVALLRQEIWDWWRRTSAALVPKKAKLVHYSLVQQPVVVSAWARA